MIHNERNHIMAGKKISNFSEKQADLSFAARFLHLLPDIGVKRVPVLLRDVTSDGPEVAKDEGGCYERVELGDVLLHINVSGLKDKHL